MTDLARFALVVAMGLAILAGLGLGCLTVGWIRDGLRELNEMFRL